MARREQTAAQDMPELLGPVADSFTRVVRHFGPVNRGVGWKSAEGHQLRMQILTELFGPETDDGGIIVNDLGCGYGAFFDVLKNHPALRDGAYIGYDIAETMLTFARERIDDPRASFVFGHRATERADYSFVCGTYNIRMYATDREWETFIEDSLSDLWSKTDVALGFNMMSSYGECPERTIYYADPARFFDFCMRELSPRVTLLHDYSLPEWTMFVYR
jgi:SAM-dependent methyltransferase